MEALLNIEKLKTKVHFKGLDELRAIAALLVFVHHVELFKSREGYASMYRISFLHNFISKIGNYSVICFFVLSGFLITYLLLSEKRQTGAINIRAFYKRRVLRIWPLYYLIIFIGFCLLPILNHYFPTDAQHVFPNRISNLDFSSIFLFLFMLSNFTSAYYGPVAGASQTWSVSLEEQFYLIWPWLLAFIKTPQNVLKFISALLILKLLLSFLARNYFPAQTFVAIFFRNFSIEYMCVGGIVATVVFIGSIPKRIIAILQNRYFTIFFGIFLFICCGLINSAIVIALLCGVLILTIIKSGFEIPFLKPIGTISYGIYMLHPLFIYLTFSLAAKLTSVYQFTVVLYLLSLLLTLALAYLSHRFYEMPFLKLKHKYNVVDSGSL